MKNNKLVIIVGGSGSGKSTLERELESRFPNEFHRAISVTTRDIRVKDGEKDGKNYFFKTKEEFNSLKLIERTEFNGNFYGVQEEQIHKSKNTVLVVEPEGLLSLEEWIKNSNIEIFLVHINIDKDERRRKMISRGDNLDLIEKRFSGETIDSDVINKITHPTDLEINEYRDDLAGYVFSKIKDKR